MEIDKLPEELRRKLIHGSEEEYRQALGELEPYNSSNLYSEAADARSQTGLVSENRVVTFSSITHGFLEYLKRFITR